jgi:hypothetical protein
MKRAIILIAMAAALMANGTAWARPQSDIPLQGSIIDRIPPEIGPDVGQLRTLESLCSPQVVLSSDKSDYAALRQCDAESCIVKVVGKMAPDRNFWDHYGKSGDFIAHLFAGTTNMFDGNNNLRFHCAPGPAEVGQYFLCIAATSADKIPPTPALRILVLDPEVCGFSPVKGLKEDADGNNIADADEGGGLPQVPLEPIGEDDDDYDETAELDEGTPAPPQFTPPVGGFDEGGGCSALPAVPVNPSAYLIISLGLAVLAWRRRA